MGQLPLSVWGLSSEGVEQCGRSAALGSFLDLQLSHSTALRGGAFHLLIESHPR